MNDLFHDRDAETALDGDGRIALGGGRVLLLPRVAGFCSGVRAALRRLEEVLARADRRIWLLGEIIHNDTVNEHFRQRGVRILPEDNLESVFSLAAATDTFVIPAFGIGRETERDLRSFAADVVDTTCVCVKQVWAFVEKQAATGRTVLLHGKPSHPETRATLSRALGPGNAAIVVPTLEHARRLAAAILDGGMGDYPDPLVHNRGFVDLQRLAVANQTTMLYDETRELESVIAQAVARVGGDLVPAETVCRATQARQDAARRLCATGLDLVLVVGGFTSSNTNQLFRLARDCAPAYFIRDAGMLAPSAIRHFDPATRTMRTTGAWLPASGGRIGLLAGASCPPGDIGEVIRALRRIAQEADQRPAVP